MDVLASGETGLGRMKSNSCMRWRSQGHKKKKKQESKRKKECEICTKGLSYFKSTKKKEKKNSQNAH